MHIERVELPGIGVGYTLHTRDGQLFGVICHRNGSRELLFYKHGDPDNGGRPLSLTAAEAQQVAELLHTIGTIDHLTHLEQQVQGITVAGLSVSATSPYDGHTLGDIAVRTRTGATVIAVIRDGQTFSGPGPEHVLTHGDVLITAGAHESINALSRLLITGDL